MAEKTLTEEEQFIKNNCLEQQYARAKEISPNLWTMLQDIKKHYEDYSEYCGAIVQKEVVEILKNSETKGIHSARFRVKKVDSLLTKIVKKRRSCQKIFKMIMILRSIEIWMLVIIIKLLQM